MLKLNLQNLVVEIEPQTFNSIEDSSYMFVKIECLNLYTCRNLTL